MLVIFLSVLTAVASETKCKCSKSTVCLTETQMADSAVHVEMETDRMGNHTNAQGVAVFEVKFDKAGRVSDAKWVEGGHPMAIPLIIGAVPKWRFRPYLLNGKAQRACGNLRLKFSIMNNVSHIEVERRTEAE